MVATGCVVGFGNFWRVPLVAGEHGGGAFWLIYLLAMLIVGIPLMLALLLVGAQGRSNPVAAWEQVATSRGRSPLWRWLGWLALMAALCLLPLNALVGGWSLAYLQFAWSGQLAEQQVSSVAGLFAGLVADIKANMLWSGVVTALATGLCALGISRGLGLAARIIVPLVFAMLVVVAWTFRHFGDIDQTMHYLFVSHWNQVSLATVVSALSQAFYSLTLGAGVFVAMGAYLPDRRDLLAAVTGVCVADALAAVLAGYILLPLVFASNIAPEPGGSGLLFVSVPAAFGNVLYGVEMSIALYLALALLTLLTVASLMEPLVATLNERLGLHRPVAALLVGGWAWLLAIAVAEYFSLDSMRGVAVDFNLMKVLGTGSQLLMPLVALLAVVCLGWGVKPQAGSKPWDALSFPLLALWQGLLRWVVAPAILIVLASTFYDKIMVQ